MINFAAICPHPPIIIPGVGNEEDRTKASKTIKGMEKLADKFKKKKPTTVVVITPHAKFDPNNFSVYSSNRLTVSLPGAILNYEGNEKLAEKISNLDNTTKIESGKLDHGSGIPLYFLKEKQSSFNIVPINYSGLSIEEHFKFGKLLGKLLEDEEKKIAVIASGDLSHKLKPSAPAGFSKRGKEFDDKIINLIQENKVDEIINFDPELIRDAGQCAYRSIITLLGILSNKETNPELLSYQGPFGVGYGVANYKIMNENED